MAERADRTLDERSPSLLITKQRRGQITKLTTGSPLNKGSNKQEPFYNLRLLVTSSFILGMSDMTMVDTRTSTMISPNNPVALAEVRESSALVFFRTVADRLRFSTVSVFCKRVIFS